MKNVAFIGNSVPRRCGIATFSTDLREAFAHRFPDLHAFGLAITDTPEGYDYPKEIVLDISEKELSSYQNAATFLNLSDVDLICLQHEFGIFGGNGGSHILTLLDQVRAPVVTTLHTVLKEPDKLHWQMLNEVARRSSKLVVMSKTAITYLVDVYGIAPEKIALVPHGIPIVPFDDPMADARKRRFGIEDRITMMTFGLLSANKGIEHVINALPRIAASHPEILYVVLGATHPNVKLHEGEVYRESLHKLAADLGVSQNVLFLDQFVGLDELVEYLAAADIYVTPYLNPDQIVSGTLSYAVGSGKAVISTPYAYANELLSGGVGILVPFGESEPIADEVLGLLNDPERLMRMRHSAHELGKSMQWSNVAEQYGDIFEEVTRTSRTRKLPGWSERQSIPVPAPSLDHLLRMSDSTGMLQHATGTIPNYAEGYTTDDNCRALSVAALLYAFSSEKGPILQPLAERNLAFLMYAFNRDNGSFRNFMSFQRTWLEEAGSEDSQGRTLEALGRLSRGPGWQAIRSQSRRVFDEALPLVAELKAVRAQAHAVLGLVHRLGVFQRATGTHDLLRELAERLKAQFDRERGTNWIWCEQQLTYENAVLPHALIAAGAALRREDLLQTGLDSLAWLCGVQKSESGCFVPIGSDFAFRRGAARPLFDQQPIEAAATISACLAALKATGNPDWIEQARVAFEWFAGGNLSGLSMIDPESGGCYDGLQPDRVNQNQGAESLLAFLQASVEMSAAGLQTDLPKHALQILVPQPKAPIGMRIAGV